MPAFSFKVYARPSLKDMGIDTARQEMLNELRSIGRAISNDLKQTVKDWDHPPQVQMKISLTRNDPQAGVEVYVDSPVLHMLDVGTKGHIVRPVRAPRLAWQTGFKMKTQPNRLWSNPGGKSGPWATSMGHWIKGVEPRHYSEALSERWDKPFLERMEAAAHRGAAKARRI